MTKFLIVIFVFKMFNQAYGGIWRKSLDFKMGQSVTKHIMPFHSGLRDLEKELVEKQRFYRGYEFDNVGNLFAKLDSKKNTLNVALASFQIMYRTPRSDAVNFYFSHILDGSNRFFQSSQDRLSGPALHHLQKKSSSSMVLSLPSTPSKLDCLHCYHPYAHAEDKIFFVLNKNTDDLLRKAWNSLGAPHGSRIEGVALHLHTRFDMCGNCSYALDWELRSPCGFRERILKFTAESINKNCKSHVYFLALVSSRQEHLVWGVSLRTLPEFPAVSISRPEEKHYDSYNSVFGFEEISNQ